MIPIIFFSLSHLFLMLAITQSVDVTPHISSTVDGMA
jgi:hypothetical protein